MPSGDGTTSIVPGEMAANCAVCPLFTHCIFIGNTETFFFGGKNFPWGEFFTGRAIQEELFWGNLVRRGGVSGMISKTIIDLIKKQCFSTKSNQQH